MFLTSALLAGLCFTKAAHSIPSQIVDSSPDMNLDVSDSAAGIFTHRAYLQYLGPNLSPKTRLCVGLSDNNTLAIGNCTQKGPITQYVYGWSMEMKMGNDQVVQPLHLYTTRSTQASSPNWQGLCVGASDPKDQGTQKASLRVTGRLPFSKNSANDCAINLGRGVPRILNPGRNVCLYAQENDASVSDGLTSRGDHWFGNETLVWRNCDMVKNDSRANFRITSGLD
jgi:hypothetical protein